MKNKLKLILISALAMSIFAGCSTSVSESGNQNETEAQTEATESADSSSQEEESEAGQSDLEEDTTTAGDFERLDPDELYLVDKTLGDVSRVDGPLEGYDQAAFEAEPAYGESITGAFAGPVCLTTIPSANVLGFYEDEGLNVEIVSGGNAVEQTGTNQSQFGGSHIAHALVPTANGTNLKFFGTVQTGCQSLLVPTDSDIQSTKDLEGKRIGLPNGIGSPDHNIVIRFLIRDNIDIDMVEWVPVELATATSALENDEIHATLMSDQYSRPFIEAGDLRVIRSITYDSDFTQEPCCVYFLNGQFKEDNPIHVEKIENALKRANQYYHDNPEDAAQLIVDNNLAAADYDTVLTNMSEYYWVVGDDVLEETLISVIDDYKAGGVLSEDINTDELMDLLWTPMN